MAGALKEQQLAEQLYATLQAVSCPLLEGLYLQEADSKLQLLCTASPHRTDILAWICCSINPDINLKLSSLKTKYPDGLTKEMAAFGNELLLCKANDLDLIRGQTNPWRQLRFLEQLLSLVPRSGGATECRMDGEQLLSELFAPENQLYLTHVLNPSLDPWPADVRALLKGDQKSSSLTQSEGEAADITDLLLCSQAALEQLQSECEFLSSRAPGAGSFSPCALRVALVDLSQLMAAFSRVYASDFRAYCHRDPPGLRPGTHAFQRVHQLLLACNAELDLLQEISEASESLSDTVNQLQTQPYSRNHGEKHTLPEQLEVLTRRYRDLLSLHQDDPSVK